MIVYTACNRDYIPGAIALYNSFKATNTGQFIVLFDGDDCHELSERGIDVIKNPPIRLSKIPRTLNRPEDTARVHCFRFAIPELTDGDRAIYIDADALILQNLQPLWDVEFSEPVAATISNAPMTKEIVGKGVPNVFGFISSLIIFNIPEWERQGVMSACDEIMRTSELEFRTGDQALMNWALLDNWHKLPLETQSHVGHNTINTYDRSKVFVWHFLGTNPWHEVPEHLIPDYYSFKWDARARWREYFEMA